MGLGDFLFGEGPDFDFEQSPEQAWLWQNIVQPLWQQMMGGQMPGLYNVPDPSSILPTSDWWSGMAPELRQGIMAPYQEASQQMLELMGSRGQTGGAGTPLTGAAGAALGEFWSRATPQAALTGWQMYQPGAMANWQAQLGQNIAGYQQQMLPFQMLPGTTQQSLPFPVVSPGTPGLIPSLSNILGPLAMGWGMGGFQNPFNQTQATPYYGSPY